MKALSLKQPWASWVAVGEKTIETRTFKVKHRGPILILASKGFDQAAGVYDEAAKHLPYGQALAIARLVDCRPMTEDDEHGAKLFYMKGKFSWVLEDIHRIEPFPVKGRLGIFDIPVTRTCLKCSGAVDVGDWKAWIGPRGICWECPRCSAAPTNKDWMRLPALPILEAA